MTDSSNSAAGAGGRIRLADSRSILSPTSGFIAQAGFTHSLTPARNCTYGCLYCYVPTMRIYGGLKPEDWQRWGQFTTFKANAAQLSRRELARDLAPFVALLACGSLYFAGPMAPYIEIAMIQLRGRLGVTAGIAVLVLAWIAARLVHARRPALAAAARTWIPFRWRTRRRLTSHRRRKRAGRPLRLRHRPSSAAPV